jgi:hypothetical protein
MLRGPDLLSRGKASEAIGRYQGSAHDDVADNRPAEAKTLLCIAVDVEAPVSQIANARAKRKPSVGIRAKA